MIVYTEVDRKNEYNLEVVDTMEVKDIFKKLPKDAVAIWVHDDKKQGRWDYLVHKVCRKYGFTEKQYTDNGDFCWRISLTNNNEE